MKEIMTVKDFAEYTGYSVGYVYQLTHRKKVTFSKPFNGKLFFKKNDVENFIFSKLKKSHDDLEEDALKHNLNRRK